MAFSISVRYLTIA